MRNQWWRGAPIAVSPRTTDICDNCGHVRWRHFRAILGECKCKVQGCDCGPMSYLFREARFMGPLDTWTNPKTGTKFSCAQPAPPSNPIERPYA